MQSTLLSFIYHTHLSWQLVIMIIAIIVLLVWIINFLNNKKSIDKATSDAWHADPSNWKVGVFYYNPKDPRLFPPKRIAGLGWTLNFANPVSIFATILLSLFIIGLVFLLVQFIPQQ